MPLLVVIFFLLPGGAFSTSADGGAFPISGDGGGGCNHRCVGSVVPYPFGFSGDCPIPLACNAATSTPLLPHSTAAAPYPILSFNSTTSTFLVSIEPSCNRSVPEAKASLTGAGYAISSRTGLFLRGDCRAPGAANCTAPSDDMNSWLLPTTPCASTDDTVWACVSSMPPPPNSAEAESGQGQFMAWEKVEGTGCGDALTASVYDGDAPRAAAAAPLQEFGVAELGWWLNGTCANATSSGAQRCAKNATCHDVETPRGTWGHRCRCTDGMVGDGFAAGNGCYHGENVFQSVALRTTCGCQH
jgi:interleukin-1 receptor-associated kinase 1